MPACFTTLSLALVLGFGPPEDEPPVQAPTSIGGGMPTTSEDAPPEAGTEPGTETGAEAATEAAPEPQPEPQPGPQAGPQPEPVPTAGAGSPFDPNAPAPGPNAAPTPHPSAAAFERRGALLDVPGYERPPGRGIVGFSVGGGLAALAISKQVLISSFCDEPACNQPQVFDRVVLTGAAVSVALGGHVRGQWRAHEDALLGVEPMKTVGLKAGGFTMMGLGIAGFVVDNVFSIICFSTADGPYFRLRDNSEFVGTCSPGISAAVMDISAVMMGVGGAMGLYGMSYDRWRLRYDKALESLPTAQFSVAPMSTRGGGGLSLSGRF